jgi:hypothetical protein
LFRFGKLKGRSCAEFRYRLCHGQARLVTTTFNAKSCRRITMVTCSAHINL